MQRKIITIVLIGLLAVGLAPSAYAFLRDMRGHWAAVSVGALQALGLVEGAPNGNFDPEAPFTRAQMAKLLALGLGHDIDAAALAGHPTRFRDVPRWHWAAGFIETVAELAVAEGYPDGRFGPEDGITRAQLAVLLVRASGLSTEAENAAAVRTAFADDREIPTWARGAVVVAQRRGIMTGLPEGQFGPNRTVTRAEGATAVLRFLKEQGLAYQLSGTLLEYDPVERRGLLRDGNGQEQVFNMTLDGTIYRDGLLVSGYSLEPLDQVVLILGANGEGLFLEASYHDFKVSNLSTDGHSLRATLQSDGSTHTWTVQPGALLFLNGRQTTVQGLHGALEGYLLWDRESRSVRLVDAVHAPLGGILAAYDPGRGVLAIDVAEDQFVYQIGDDVVVVVDWTKASLEDLVPGAQVRYALDANGQFVTYIQAER